MAHQSTISDLPDKDFAGILARLPFSKAKAAAQLVSHRWRDALLTPPAHSLDTQPWDSHFSFKSDPTTLQALQLSEGLINAMAGLKIETGGGFSFGPDLQDFSFCRIHLVLAMQGKD